MMPHRLLFAITVVSALTTAAPARSQEMPMPSAGALKVALDRLQTTARVLYVAAHPDDENTRLLAYLANHRHVDVAYLSLTRGGGGQNLIGPEQAELLAAIRTQELLAARRIDGARQFFTRARDFGYSKSPEEALKKWGRDAVLSDVVWVVRKFRPDIIVTRFTETGPSHGHHTASAQLARAAFQAASDPQRFPEHFQNGVTPWSPTRIAINVPRWGRSSDDVSGYLALDVGGYDPRLGASYGELAARSRTNHKSQGFGSSGRRGPIMEYFENLEGPPPKDDLLDGLALGWDRFDGGDNVHRALEAATRAYSVESPEKMVPHLLEARAALEALAKRQPVPRVLERLDDVDVLIAQALGLYADVEAERAEVTAGDKIKLNLELILRRPGQISVTSVQWPDGQRSAQGTDGKPHALAEHTPLTVEQTVRIASRAVPSVQHWLREPLSADTYPVTEPAKVADPEDSAPMTVRLNLKLAGRPWTLTAPVIYRWTDPVIGERRRPLIVVPPITVTPATKISLFPGGATREVLVVARAGRADAKGTVRLGVPRAWKSEPVAHEVKLAKPGDEITLRFLVTPPSANAAPVVVAPYARIGRRRSSLRFDRIDYPHLPVQALLRPGQLRLVPLDFTPPKGRIGYITGSGDTVPAHLRAAGVNVESIDSAAIKAGRFDDYDAIIFGVRAYNVRDDELRPAYPALMKWVENGGRMVVQYTTSNRWRKLTFPIGPFPFEIDRERVTDETAKMTVLEPKHALFASPHKITAKDFEDWVQERGLYFAKTWNERYTPLLSANDPGESATKGSLLVAQHGKGSFIYTGLSFFRQLPAGVPGAYRLLANLISPEATR